MKTIQDVYHKNGTGKKSTAKQEPEFAERRKATRLRPESLSAVLTFGEDWWPVSVMDISLGGARVVNPPQAVKIDDVIYLTTCPDGQRKVTVACRVRHSNASMGWTTIGVEFIDPSTEGFGPIFAEMDAVGKRILSESHAIYNGKK